ncbi:MAG: zinc ribbon domain-containing protein [Phycisphaerae bacterium]|nr:zinc ribbon domain-containing protein [Phycisphaerae bacterium]MDW8262841.1 zinc ribbon domain-containing protein [Phycisphaerales bacterium]
MPTYEYRCEECEHEFEAFQSITASPLRKCPECKRPKLRRLIGSGAALLFKGDGFYITDYRSESYKKAAKADGAGSSAGQSSEAKSQSASGDASSSTTKADSKAAMPGKAAAKGSKQKLGN